MRKPILRPATNQDVVKFYGTPMNSKWFGFVADDGLILHGIGGVVLCPDGKWFAFFKRTPGCRSKILLHKAALLVFDHARSMKINVFAYPQNNIKDSAMYMMRLGFFRTKQRTSACIDGVGGQKVWVKPWEH